KDSTDRWVYVVYLLALNTAMRAGEIWGLKPSDLSRDGRSIQVRRQFNRVTLEMAPTKSKKSRLAPLNDELREEIEHLIKTKSIEADETIFMNELRNPVCHENFVKRQFLVDVKAWGGRSIRFHDLRHSATTMMIAGGIDLKTVKEICGHADIATTMTYVHLISGAVERVAQVFSVTRKT
ncbi:MAG: tyrosine-type recombinase/integrase, partial [Bdellovibrionales bacterium]|nr:tyrosine-type recombinase/integrase [Bdellovibrionales bacterium]